MTIASVAACVSLDGLQGGGTASPECDGSACLDGGVAADAPSADGLSPEAGEQLDVDVAVVGAGAGGIAAAIQASRLGRSVALIEETGQVGGQLLTVTSMDDVARVRSEGIYGEILSRIGAVYAAQLPPKSMSTCYFSATEWRAFEASVGERALRQLLDETDKAGKGRLRVLTQKRVTSVEKDAAGRVAGVTAPGLRVSARYVIDATEYGDLLPLAGAAYRVGNGKWDPATGETPNSAACVQDLTYTATIQDKKSFAAIVPGLDLRNADVGADYGAAKAHFKTRVSRSGARDGGVPVDFGMHNAYRGTPDSTGASYVSTDFDKITKTMVNYANDYSQLDAGSTGPDTSRGLPVAAVLDANVRREHECRARLRTLQFIRYVQEGQAQGGLEYPWALSDEQTASEGTAEPCDPAIVPPGLEAAARLFPHRPYVREGRRVVGVRTLTGRQIFRDGPQRMPEFGASARESFSSALLLGYHRPDLHRCSATSTLETAELGEVEADGAVTTSGPFQVPFGTFIPKTIDGLLVAEKNLSVSRLVGGVVRLHAMSVLSGQAAGTLAALAIERTQEARAVPPILVQRKLIATGVSTSLDAFTDVPRSHPRWADVQLVSTHRILMGFGGLLFSVDSPLTREQMAVIFQRALHYPKSVATSATFADVPTSHPSFSYIQALAEQGITLGNAVDGGTTTFNPTANVSREQMAIFLVRALGAQPSLPATCTSPYTDVVPSDTGCGAIQYLASLGLKLECGAGTFCPKANLTRGEAAQFLSEAILQLAAGTGPKGECYRTPPDYCEKLN